VSEAARALGCDRQTLYNYLKKYPELLAAQVLARESLVDLAEGKLGEAVEAGEMRAIIFTLETLGKKRGYARRTELTGEDGAPLGLPPEVAQKAREMGVEPSELMAEIVTLIMESK
jgi:hypothetical protein